MVNLKGKISVENLLIMKRMVEKNKPEYEWVINNSTTDYEIALDDGGQTYFHVQYKKEEIDKLDVQEIAEGLALFLNIPCEWRLLK